AHRVEAENLLREAIAAEPHLPAVRLALAAFLLENLRYAGAETVAAAAVQCCPSSAELRLVLARIQFQLRRFEDAARTIEALLAITPDLAWPCFDYGKILPNSITTLAAPIGLLSAPAICRETIVLCWPMSLNSFYTISITGKLRNFTSDFSSLFRAYGKIL